MWPKEGLRQLEVPPTLVWGDVPLLVAKRGPGPHPVLVLDLVLVLALDLVPVLALELELESAPELELELALELELVPVLVLVLVLVLGQRARDSRVRELLGPELPAPPEACRSVDKM